MKKTVLIIMIVFVAIILAASVLYFFNGSLEMFPTAEKESSVQLAMGIVAVSGVVTEAILVSWLKKALKEKSENQR